jgi:hypothetical protein
VACRRSLAGARWRVLLGRTLGAMQDWLEIERTNRMDTMHSLELV